METGKFQINNGATNSHFSCFVIFGYVRRSITRQMMKWHNGEPSFPSFNEYSQNGQNSKFLLIQHTVRCRYNAVYFLKTHHMFEIIDIWKYKIQHT